MSAEIEAFALQKMGVMFLKGRGTFNRRTREKKEKKDKERGVRKIGTIKGLESASLRLSTGVVGMTMLRAQVVPVVCGTSHTPGEQSLCW